MILAVQRLRQISKGGHILARYTIGYYVCTTLIASKVDTSSEASISKLTHLLAFHSRT